MAPRRDPACIRSLAGLIVLHYYINTVKVHFQLKKNPALLKILITKHKESLFIGTPCIFIGVISKFVTVKALNVTFHV